MRRLAPRGINQRKLRELQEEGSRLLGFSGTAERVQAEAVKKANAVLEKDMQRLTREAISHRESSGEVGKLTITVAGTVLFIMRTYPLPEDGILTNTFPPSDTQPQMFEVTIPVPGKRDKKVYLYNELWVRWLGNWWVYY